MTMTNRHRTIAAGKFKATCLALLDEVARTGRPLVVTKHGRPVAQLVPVSGYEPASLLGSVLEEGDLVSPIDVEWDAAHPRDER